MAHVKDAATDHPIHAALAERWSPYGFADRPVSEDDLRSVFEAARWAASSYNEQPWRYLVARREDPEAFGRMLSCLVEPNQAWARAAPVLAIGATSLRFARNDKPNKAAHHDLGLASATLTVEATNRGLFVHQMIGILPERVRALYGVPEHVEPLTALALGHLAPPDSLPEKLRERDLTARTRKSLPEIVFGDAWETPADWL